MNHMPQSKLTFVIILIVLFLVSCNSNDNNDKIEENDPYSYIVTTVESQYIAISGSEFQVETNNCGASTSARESFSRSRSFDVQLEVDTTASLGSEFEGDILVAGAKTKAALEATLGIKIGATETINAERSFETPADSISRITLQWEEIWSVGEVTVTDGTEEKGAVPFRILTTLRLAQKGIYESPCTAVSAPASVPTATPIYRIGSIRPREKDGANMVYVPAGKFTMGSDIAPDELIHEVYLDSYWIDQTEVTNGMYSICEREGICQRPSNTSAAAYPSYYLHPDLTNYPVVYISWSDAATYCQWAGGRLPTEAEWEKAARWDEVNHEARTYPWGEVIDCNFANYSNCRDKLVSVDSYPNGQSPYKALNMAGNVSEWVHDWYSANYYSWPQAYKNPTGPGDGAFRVLRGGEYGHADEDYVRSSRRTGGIPPRSYYDYVGFRCAQDE